MAPTSNLFAALVGLTETPESTTDGTDEDGFIEIRRKHKGRTSQPSGRAPGNSGKQQQQRRQPYQSKGQQQERPSTGRPVGTAAHNGGSAAEQAHEATLAESLDHATLREEPAAKPQRKNGKSLSYAAVIADSCAPQQPAGNQPTSAEPALSAPAEEGSASGSTNSAAPSAGAEAGAAADAKSGNSRQKKSGLRQPLVWLDLEMTGLDLEMDTIIEAACLVSDGSLDTVIEGPEVVIQQNEEVLESMNAWCIEHHGASGLTQRCRESTTSMQEAEEQLLAFVAEHTEPGEALLAFVAEHTEPGEARLAGNSVHVDMQFLRRHMPEPGEAVHDF
ncbi:g1534 [Coccomyxa elongata]